LARGESVNSRRIHQPPDVLLFSYPIGTGPGIKTDYQNFVVTTPSARIMLKLSFIWWQSLTGQATPAAPFFDSTLGGALANGLWLAGAEQVDTGQYAPATNYVGTVGPAATPAFTTVPLDAAGSPTICLNGFSADFQGGQDAVMGQMKSAVTAYAGSRGMKISMRARWEPVGTDICDKEWSELVARMSISTGSTVKY
jgi:hypothetical protein